MSARYALYYAPAPHTAAWRAGSHWLGRCAASGEALEQPMLDGIDPPDLRALTAAPRRYGFHATLKAPFRLARGATLDELTAELDDFCRARQAFDLPRLRIEPLDDFVALAPESAASRAHALCDECVTHFDRFRAPLTDEEHARRRRVPLSRRQDEHLKRWGYPWVLDEFRLHFSLTGPLGAACDGPPGDSLAAHASPFARKIRNGAEAALAAALRAPMRFDAICVFEQESAGADFRIVHRAPLAGHGRLVYVVGPSGTGKDSLLAWVRERVAPEAGVVFARRTITRAAHTGDENHIPVSATQFELKRAQGAFAMCWRANGHSYGIGNEILDWLDRGSTVVVNGSREYLPEARALFPFAEVVHVTAPAELLRERLVARGREAPDEAEARLARNERSFDLERVTLTLSNAGPLEDSGARMLGFLLSRR
jgi:ribose 1,5-bisphosphokinase